MRSGAVALVLCVLTAAAAAGGPAGLPPERRGRRLAQVPAPQPAPPALQPQLIRPDRVYYPAKGVLAAPNTAVQGPPLQLNATAAASIEACSELCRSTPGCDWFWYCSRPGGCSAGGGALLEFQACQLVGEACVLPTLGLSGSGSDSTEAEVEVTSGKRHASRTLIWRLRGAACMPWSGRAPGTSAAVRIGVHSACPPGALPTFQAAASLPAIVAGCLAAAAWLYTRLSLLQAARNLTGHLPPPTRPAGFPTASVFGDQVFKFTELQGQGIEGEDLVCDASIVPGKCVLPIAGEAALVCHAMGPMCRAVTVYLNGAHKNGMAAGNSNLWQPARWRRLGCGASLLEPAGQACSGAVPAMHALRRAVHGPLPHASQAVTRQPLPMPQDSTAAQTRRWLC